MLLCKYFAHFAFLYSLCILQWISGNTWYSLFPCLITITLNFLYHKSLARHENSTLLTIENWSFITFNKEWTLSIVMVCTWCRHLAGDHFIGKLTEFRMVWIYTWIGCIWEILFFVILFGYLLCRFFKINNELIVFGSLCYKVGDASFGCDWVDHIR